VFRPGVKYNLVSGSSPSCGGLGCQPWVRWLWAAWAGLGTSPRRLPGIPHPGSGSWDGTTAEPLTLVRVCWVMVSVLLKD
jgi:hypothetical protein